MEWNMVASTDSHSEPTEPAWIDLHREIEDVATRIALALVDQLTTPAPASGNAGPRLGKASQMVGTSYDAMKIPWADLESAINTLLVEEGLGGPLEAAFRASPFASAFQAWRKLHPNPNHETARDVITRWLTHLFFDAEDFAPQSDRIRNAFSTLCQTITGNSLPMVTLAPIHGFSSTDHKLDLGDGVAIARLTDAERRAIAELGEAPFKMEGENADFAIKVPWRLQFNALGTQNRDEAWDLAFEPVMLVIDRVRDALRLFRIEGDLSVPILFHLRMQPAPHQLLVSSFAGATTHPFYPYSFEGNDGQAFRHLYEQVVSAETESRLRLAIRRFGAASERPAAEDKLVDLVISAEAALGQKGRELGRRMSVLLGRDPPERLRLLALCKAAIDVRNDLVHGTEPRIPATYRHAYRLARSFADITRRALTILLEHTATGNPRPDWNALICGAVPTPGRPELLGLPDVFQGPATEHDRAMDGAADRAQAQTRSP